jgi:hypothetical protein
MKPVGQNDVEHVFRGMQRDITRARQEIDVQISALQTKI